MADGKKYTGLTNSAGYEFRQDEQRHMEDGCELSVPVHAMGPIVSNMRR
jgi:hypothetical protein